MNSTNNCMVVIEATFNQGGQETEEFKEYAQRSNANGQSNGGKLIAKYFISGNIGQGQTSSLVIVFEFPSKEAAEINFTNDEYNAIIPLRDVAFKEVKILLSDKYET